MKPSGYLMGTRWVSQEFFLLRKKGSCFDVVYSPWGRRASLDLGPHLATPQESHNLMRCDLSSHVQEQHKPQVI
jgi:hypothetical protein